MFDELWEWDGQEWREAIASGSSPGSKRLHAAAVHTGKEELILVGDGKAGEIWAQNLSPNNRPSAIVDFAWDSANARTDASTSALCGMTFYLKAQGTGYTLDTSLTDGDDNVVGDPVSGVRIHVWDGTISAWRKLEVDTASPDCIRTDNDFVCTITDVLQARRLVYGANRQISMRVTTSAANGNGPMPAQLTIDYAELKVDYDLSGTCD